MAGVLHWVTRDEWAAMQNARRRRLMGGATPTPHPDADILALFAIGEQGAWYDPSDLTTMFQDNVGTVPVTADGQPVGLILDKRLWGGKTLAQVIAGQPEKFADQIPTINNAGGSDGAYTPATKTCANTATGTESGYPRFTFDLGLTAGRYYSVTGKLTGDTSAVLLVQLATSGSTSRPSYNPATGDIRGIVPASSQHFQLILNGTLGAKAVSIMSLSVKEIPGNHASQTTVASRPTYRSNGVLSWLAFDGVDDYLFLPNLNLGTDKATILMGAYRANDTTGIVYELSDNWNLNAGSFVQTNAAAPQYWTASSRGDATGSGSQVAYTSQSGEDTAVITALHDISGDLSRVRRNGVVGTDGTGDKGTGNFGSYPLRIGIRGDGTLPFNGRIYGIVIRSALTADPDLSKAERWMASKTGVVL